MLRRITIDGFRSFNDVVLSDLAALTLLVGPNNVGKSSVIHLLLSLLQSEERGSGHQLLLSGDWCDLGHFDRVVRTGRNEKEFSLGLALDEKNEALLRFGPPGDPEKPVASILEWSYRVDNSWGVIRADSAVQYQGIDLKYNWNGSEHVEQEGERSGKAIFRDPLQAEIRIPIHTRSGVPAETAIINLVILRALSTARTWHIGPHRIPPRSLYEAKSSKIGSRLGRYCEYTAEYLYRHRGRETDFLPPPGTNSPSSESLLTRVNQWWSYIFEGNLNVYVDAPLKMGFSMSVSTPQAEQLDLGQVGFGLSQALPIVVAAVGSRPGDLLLIETPEAHLHPGAQHRLGMMFAELARAGRQVILETHSEHMVNALRLAVKRGMPKEQTAIWFFRDDEGRTIAEPIPVDDHGRILKSLPGFFDQAVLELSELLR